MQGSGSGWGEGAVLQRGGSLLTWTLPSEAFIKGLRNASGLREALVGDPSQQNPEETKSF